MCFSRGICWAHLFSMPRSLKAILWICYAWLNNGHLKRNLLFAGPKEDGERRWWWRWCWGLALYLRGNFISIRFWFFIRLSKIHNYLLKIMLTFEMSEILHISIVRMREAQFVCLSSGQTNKPTSAWWLYVRRGACAYATGHKAEKVWFLTAFLFRFR